MHGVATLRRQGQRGIIASQPPTFVRNTALRRTLASATRLVLSVVSAAICLAIAPVGAAPGRPAPGLDRSDREVLRVPPSSIGLDSPVDFRLGTASSPFGGSSTAIGDFNTDGQPDLAIADHLPRRAGGYAYRIEFQISGQPRRDVTFESAHEAVTLSVSDVDRDNDLDLVVGSATSGETVGIWLNDGHGHFSWADARRFPNARKTTRAVITDERASADDRSALTSRSIGVTRPDDVRVIALHTSDRFPSIDVLGILSAALLSRIHPRAPPCSSFAFVS
jgi:hypothetical protein